MPSLRPNSIFICNLNSWLDVSSAVSFISVYCKREYLDYDENVTGLFMPLALFEMLAHQYFNPQGCGAGVEKPFVCLCLISVFPTSLPPPPPYYGKQWLAPNASKDSQSSGTARHCGRFNHWLRLMQKEAGCSFVSELRQLWHFEKDWRLGHIYIRTKPRELKRMVQR